jgi:hypothetical protein
MTDCKNCQYHNHEKNECEHPLGATYCEYYDEELKQLWSQIKQLNTDDISNEAEARQKIYRQIPNLSKMYDEANDDLRFLICALVDAKIDGHLPVRFLNKPYRKHYQHLRPILEKLLDDCF